MDLQMLALDLDFLSVLRNLAQHPLIQKYRNALRALSGTPHDFAESYGALCAEIYQNGDQGQVLLRSLHCDTNALTDTIDHPSANVISAASHDVRTLNDLLSVSGSELLDTAKSIFGQALPSISVLPTFASGSSLPFADGDGLRAYYQDKGFGFFADATFYAVDTEKIVPVVHPDPVRLTDLKGYAHQKAQILTNTRAFLAGRAANNILLYGDKGTGKSSTVKAVVNEYAKEGLKIIELSVTQISMFPVICTYAAHSPYKIIVFLDDLTFEREDENFATLKAFIEGGLTGKPDNLILYATSNRRHLIRERFSDREGDDVHRRDTLETVTSLSDRFGLEITFSVPERDEYLMIVDQLAEDCGIEMEAEQLHLLAERFALRRNGRSPRTARQFIQMQLAQEMA